MCQFSDVYVTTAYLPLHPGDVNVIIRLHITMLSRGWQVKRTTTRLRYKDP